MQRDAGHANNDIHPLLSILRAIIQVAEALERLTALFPGLRIGVKPDGDIRCLRGIPEGLFPSLPTEVVVSQNADEFTDPDAKDRLHRVSHLLMELLAGGAQQRLISDLLREGMFKRIFDLRQSRSFTNQLRLLQQGDLSSDSGFLGRDALEYPVKKNAANHRCFLHDLPGFIGKPVQAGQQDALQSIRHLHDPRQGVEFPTGAVALKESALNQRPQHLFEKEGISARFFQNFFAQAVGEIIAAQ